jgi:hypothetical protein
VFRQLVAQELILVSRLVQDAGEGFDVGRELGDLLGVGGPEPVEPPCPFTQAPFAVRRAVG